jgi:DNA polymerase (family X)
MFQSIAWSSVNPYGIVLFGSVVTAMDKDRVASVLDEIATLLELQGENPFRCQAYRNAARAVQQLEGNLVEIVSEGKLKGTPGIGDTLHEKITILVTTGRLPFHDELKSKIPAGLVEMLRLPGVGPKKVKALFDQLGIENLQNLKQACDEGRVASLKGFGAKTQQKIVEGIAFLGQSGQGIRLDQAEAVADNLLEGLRRCRDIIRMEVCGSLRRRKEVIRDIDLLASSKNAAPVMEHFGRLPGVSQIIGLGETKSSVVIDRGIQEGRRLVINADLRVVSDQQFPFALNYFTGSKEHNVALRGRAQDFGLKLNEYELAGDKGPVRCKEESDVYRALKLDYVPPELREHTGEIEAAAQHQLPKIIQQDDLQGTFHCHSKWSDGAATIEEMARAAKSLGLKYLGIADHSQSLAVASGLSLERLQEQQAEIDSINRRLKGITLLKGTECDILPDGRLDYPDEVLRTFDFVVASVHTHFNQPAEEMTTRVVRAVSHPLVTMLGHATGRILLRREGYKMDMEAVLKAAAKHGTWIEINAYPARLEIDWLTCKRAKSLGIKLVINPDAHATEEIAFIRYGVDVARRGWLEKADVVNALPLDEVIQALQAKKKK